MQPSINSIGSYLKNYFGKKTVNVSIAPLSRPQARNPCNTKAKYSKEKTKIILTQTHLPRRSPYAMYPLPARLPR